MLKIDNEKDEDDNKNDSYPILPQTLQVWDLLMGAKQELSDYI